MFEIDVEGNETGLKVFVNDLPDLTTITKHEEELFIYSLEESVFRQLAERDKTDDIKKPP